MSQKLILGENLDKRRRRNAESAQRLHILLSIAVDFPEKADVQLINACGNQKDLAALSLPRRDITSMSLNTLKAAAGDGLLNGWSDIDELRKKLKQIVHASDRKKDARAARAERKTSEKSTLQTRIDEGLRIRALTYAAYRDLLGIARIAASGNDEIARRLSTHENLYKEQFGPRSVSEEIKKG